MPMPHYGYAGLLAGPAGLLAVVAAIAGSTVSAGEHGRYLFQDRRLLDRPRTRHRVHPVPSGCNLPAQRLR
jgi:hypothetical protein